MSSWLKIHFARNCAAWLAAEMDSHRPLPTALVLTLLNAGGGSRLQHREKHKTHFPIQAVNPKGRQTRLRLSVYFPPGSHQDTSHNHTFLAGKHSLTVLLLDPAPFPMDPVLPSHGRTTFRDVIKLEPIPQCCLARSARACLRCEQELLCARISDRSTITLELAPAELCV